MKAKLLLLFSAISLYGFSQDTSLLLRNYKYRTPGYKALAVSFNFSGSTNSSKTENNNESSNKNFSLGPVFLSYARVVSTDTRLHQSSLSLSPLASFSKNKVNGKEATYRRLQPYFAWDRNDRFYKKGGWFLEAGNRVTASFDAEKLKDSLQNYKTNNLWLTDDLTVGVGKGRVERVQDAQMALYLLQDLAAQGLLNKPATAEDANELARLITDINNRRIFDSRRRRMYELTRLDSFFRSSGLATQTDIRHFTTINDDWAFAINPYRLSGANWYVRLQPSIRYNHFKYNNANLTPVTSSELSNTTFSFGPAIGYTNYLPLSLKWQRDFGFSASYVRNKNSQKLETIYPNDVFKYNIDTADHKTTFTGFYSIGYFPNTRTQITALLLADGTYYKNKDLLLVTSLGITANYFLSYRTYLTASASAGYTRRVQHTTVAELKGHDVYGSLGVSLSHIVF